MGPGFLWLKISALVRIFLAFLDVAVVNVHFHHTLFRKKAFIRSTTLLSFENIQITFGLGLVGYTKKFCTGCSVRNGRFFGEVCFKYNQRPNCGRQRWPRVIAGIKVRVVRTGHRANVCARRNDKAILDARSIRFHQLGAQHNLVAGSVNFD